MHIQRNMVETVKEWKKKNSMAEKGKRANKKNKHEEQKNKNHGENNIFCKTMLQKSGCYFN